MIDETPQPTREERGYIAATPVRWAARLERLGVRLVVALLVGNWGGLLVYFWLQGEDAQFWFLLLVVGVLLAFVFLIRALARRPRELLASSYRLKTHLCCTVTSFSEPMSH